MSLPDVTNPARKNPSNPADEQPIVECEGLKKWYGAVCALRNVDLKIFPGEVIGLVGDNGAGKSTLIKILSGVHPPDGGRIIFDGKPVQIRNPRTAMLLGIETIYQYSAIIPELSIQQNIFLGRELRLFGARGTGVLDRRRMSEETLRIIRDLGLRRATPDTPIKELSGGQRQGITIGRAMYFKSKVLILDEPTNHLSVKETNKLLDRILVLKRQGITCIFISHNLHHIHPIADRIVAMARGEKVADLKPQDTTIEELVTLIS
jgi:simple sugar transport system ATP-binding protein